MPSTHFDIAIIGAGAAGLHLALAMRDEPFFQNKRVLILEKTAKDQNDRTWCFWEKDKGLWDQLLRHSWSKGDFFSANKSRPLSLPPYRYKMLRAIDFYEFSKQKIASSPIFYWQNEDVQSVEASIPICIKGQQGNYTADYVFDSRIPDDFFHKKDKYTRLLQHFKGWVVRTPDDRFDPSRFTMMDFRLLWPGTTSFTYVLPINKREALVEFTLFSTTLLNDQDYDHMLHRYIKEVLKLDDFDVIEREQGVIPMSDFPFEKYSQGNHIRIGTGGGWVKPSTGYSFKNSERYAQKIVKNMKAGRPANKGLLSPKFRFYDALFLDLLTRKNDFGPYLFETLYVKIKVQQVFRFLDDETNLTEDVRIMLSFPPWPFLHSLANYITR